MTIDFGFAEPEVEPETFSIGNQVWADANDDGVIDEDELPVPAVLVGLFATNEDGVADLADVVAATFTDEEGLYLFDGLDAGEYVVGVAPASLSVEGPLAGLSPSAVVAEAGADVDADNDGALDVESGYVLSAPVTLGDGEPLGELPNNDPLTADELSNLTIDFGFAEAEVEAEPEPEIETFSIGNQVWADANNDGLFGEDELPVAGVEVELFDADDEVIASTITNDEGLYLFDGLDAGEYVVGIAPAAFAEGEPLADKIPSTVTVADANTDIDADNNGVADRSIGYVLSAPVTLGDGEPVGELPNNDAVTADELSNATIDFGFYEPDFELEIDLALREGADDGAAEIGEEVVFALTVTNTGEVIADDIEVLTVLSRGLANIDPEWTVEGDGFASFTVPGELEPEESMTVQMTTEVVGDELTAFAEIADAQGLDDNGVPITSVLGISLLSSNSPTNAVSFSFANTQTPEAPVLAFTGVESGEIALLAALLLSAGFGMVLFTGRRRRRISVRAGDKR